MTRLLWEPQHRTVEEGLDRGVLYSEDSAIPWNGLIEILEKDSSDVIVEQYLDGVRSVVVQNLGEYSAQISCFTYPNILDGPGRFGFSYRVPLAEGHKVHLVYNAIFKSSDRVFRTLTDVQTPMDFRWDLDATPVQVLGSNPVAHLILETTEYPEVTEELEGILYGTPTSDPRLPTPQEVIDICESVAILHVQYNGDGTWTVTGPDEMVKPNADGTFELSAPTAFQLDGDRFIVGTY